MSHDLAEIAASGATFRLFHAVRFAEPPATIPVLPKPGTYRHPTYGEITLTPERATNFVNGFKSGIYQRHIPIDAEHQSKLSGALGYLTDLILNEEGGVDAAVEWTDRGTKLVAADRYRYVSPEWYDTWIDPATETEYRDVLVGLALTTRPFFKDGALRPLVAHEGELIVPDRADKEGEADVTDSPRTDETPQASEGTMSEQETQKNEPLQMSEEATKRFAELETKLATETQRREAAESQATQLAERVATIEAERRRDGFIAEITGKSAANGHRWFGEVDKHLAILEALPDEPRQAYIEQQRAIAAQMKTSLFREIGSDAHAESATAEQEIERRATKLAAEKGITKAQAWVQVEDADPDLRRRYAAERPHFAALED